MWMSYGACLMAHVSCMCLIESIEFITWDMANLHAVSLNKIEKYEKRKKK